MRGRGGAGVSLGMSQVLFHERTNILQASSRAGNLTARNVLMKTKGSVTVECSPRDHDKIRVKTASLDHPRAKGDHGRIERRRVGVPAASVAL